MSANSNKMAVNNQIHSLESIINKSITGNDLLEVKKILYGRSDDHELPITTESETIAQQNDFDIAAYSFPATKEDTRAPRIVKVGIVQTKVAVEPSQPVSKQIKGMFDKMGHIIDAAGQEGVNILCLQEFWTSPYFFCTLEKQPWCEFAEPAEDGPSFQFLQKYAIKYNMVICAGILERDETHGDVLWDTVIVINDTGKYLGKSRKNHIPRAGVFKESAYYYESGIGHPVFKTKYGKIAFNICYGHLHPLNWAMYGMNGAEIVFNPSATVDYLTEHVWDAMARYNAIANSYFTCAINRVGSEVFPNAFTYSDGNKPRNDCSYFFGASFITAPDGVRTPGLSRVKDGLLIAEMDLNLCRQTTDKYAIKLNRRLDYYADKLAEVVKVDYKPQVVEE